MKVIPFILLKEGSLLLSDGSSISNPLDYCRALSGSGADSLFFLELMDSEEDHHRNLELLKELSRGGAGSFIAGGLCSHIDDVKKYLYSGADGMCFAGKIPEKLLAESLARFKEKKVSIAPENGEEARKAYAMGVRRFYCVLGNQAEILDALEDYPDAWVAGLDNVESVYEDAGGILLNVAESQAGRVLDIKHALKDRRGIETDMWTAAFGWEELKKNSDGLVPVIVQDADNLEVLMMAYMNQEAYEMTIATGRMTYFSRSRQQLWIKGETSGHYQYVRSLAIDCDEDTLLARVIQIGAACHTGNRSCFYRDVMNRGNQKDSPYEVLESVYATITDHKIHPREGSYTNYLLSKGMDKILKKLGEEAVEIVIAAKNPDPQEVVYEMGDFLYNAMVLMAEKGITWQDIAKELSDREQ